MDIFEKKGEAEVEVVHAEFFGARRASDQNRMARVFVDERGMMVSEFSEECKRQTYKIVNEYIEAFEECGAIKWDSCTGGRSSTIGTICRTVAATFQDNSEQTPQEMAVGLFFSLDNPAGSFIVNKEAFDLVLVGFGMNKAEIDAKEHKVRESVLTIRKDSLEKVAQLSRRHAGASKIGLKYEQIPSEVRKSLFVFGVQNFVEGVVHGILKCSGSNDILNKEMIEIVARISNLCKHDFERFGDNPDSRDFLCYDNLVEWLTNNILPLPEIQRLFLNGVIFVEFLAHQMVRNRIYIDFSTFPAADRLSN